MRKNYVFPDIAGIKFYEVEIYCFFMLFHMQFFSNMRWNIILLSCG